MLGVSVKHVLAVSSLLLQVLKAQCGFLHEYTCSSLNEGFVVQPVVIRKEGWEPLHERGYMTAVEGDRRAAPWGKCSPG